MEERESETKEISRLFEKATPSERLKALQKAVEKMEEVVSQHSPRFGHSGSNRRGKTEQVA